MSASPAASQNDAQVSGQPAKSGNEQVKFRFCGDCSNMLAPKEDRLNNKLMYCCRMCQYSEEADSACIFRNNIYNVIGETAGVTQDVGSDPTKAKKKTTTTTTTTTTRKMMMPTAEEA
ncbi:DNA-directed RNA polymerase II core subunit rpb9, variant 2 [Xanthoria parietina]